MKYYVMCKKLLGQRQFDDLISKLTKQIIDKFTSSIFVDNYMQILENNIKVIMLIALCNVLELDENEKIEKIALGKCKELLVVDSFREFEQMNKYYINKITYLLS